MLAVSRSWLLYCCCCGILHFVTVTPFGSLSSFTNIAGIKDHVPPRVLYFQLRFIFFFLIFIRFSKLQSDIIM